MIVSVLYRIPFDDSYEFEWFHLLALPVGFGFIKYGWRWVRNIIDLTEEKYLSPDSPYYKKAVKKAQMNLNTFRDYLAKGDVECFALFPIKAESGKTIRAWFILHHFDIEKHQFNGTIATKIDDDIERSRMFLNPENLEDWQVAKGDKVLGYFTYLASIEKAKDEGYRLNYKSKRLKEGIIT